MMINVLFREDEEVGMADPSNHSVRQPSGRRLVIGMLLLGVAATAFLWTWWTVTMTPWMPLQEALEKRFPDSAPHVMGGRVKKTGQTVLRIVLKTDFDPRSTDAGTAAKIEQRIAETRRLAEQLTDLSSWDILAVHLYHLKKERGISQKTFFRNAATGEAIDLDVSQEQTSTSPVPIPPPSLDLADSPARMKHTSLVTYLLC